MFKIQNSLETIILISVVLIIFVAVFLLFSDVFNNSGIKYLASPYILNNLNLFNFASQQSTCSFDFSYSLNEYSPGNQSDLYFILNNGVKIMPNYNDYFMNVSEATTGVYSYTYTQVKQESYNSSVCTSIAQSNDKGYYIKYIERKLSDGSFIVQPTSSDVVFTVNNKNTNPATLYNNNTVYLDASFITDSGIVSITNQNGTKVLNSPFAFGEYLYLPSGNYTISYSNESNPADFMYWNYSGGVIISNPFSSTTNVMVLNNGKIFANLRNTLAISQYFNIYSNKTYVLTGTKVKVAVEPPVEKGFYTFYVKNQPYSGCIHETKSSCNISESVGNYTISAIFENSTQYLISYPIEVNFYTPPYILLSGSYSNKNVTLNAVAKGGYGTNIYSFYYPNGTVINGCQNIWIPTCKFYADLSASVNINIYNPATTLFDGPNGAQVELQPNLTSLGVQTSIGYNRFFDGSTELYAWCESNCSSDVPNVWVNIPSGIGPEQSVTITLNGSFIKNEYSVSVSNSGGSAINSTNVSGTGKQYSYFSGHMGYSGQNDDIGSVMNSGLVYQIYYDNNQWYEPSLSTVYQSLLLNGYSISSGGQIWSSSTNYYFTPSVGTTQNINGGYENYVINNLQSGYSGGNGGFPNPPVSNGGNSYFIKEFGFAKVTTPTNFYIVIDDGGALGISSNTYNFTDWLGGNSNPSNLINEWRGEGAAFYSSSTVSTGDYGIEYDYFNGGGGAYWSLWSNNPVYYYSPTPYPNNQAPIITYKSSPQITYNPNKNLTFINNEYVEQSNGFSWMNNPTQQFTISIWVDPNLPNGVILDELGQTAINTGWHDSWIELVNGNVYIRVWSLGCVNLGSIPLNSWSNIVMTGSVSGSTLTYSGYINGALKSSGSGGRSTPGGSSLMYYVLGSGDGTNCGSGAFFNGEMANYQFYNAVVSPTSIYNAGINGTPPVTSGLELWYPLNGTTIDYSGNNNNGQIV